MLDFALTLGLQSTLVLAMAALLATLFRRGSAAQRHCLWTIAFGILALLPWWPEQGWTWRKDQIAVPTRVSDRMVIRVSAEPEPFDWTAASQPVWMIGAGLLLLRLTAAQWRCRAIRRRARPGRSGYLYSPEVYGPLLLGLWRPQVLLPVSAEHWTEERLRVVMLHERTHVERWDLWWMTMGQIVAALFWPQPLVWLALRAQRIESEQACDDCVVRAGVKASCYADHLVAIASSPETLRLGNERWMTKGGLAMAQQSQLEQRLRAMLNPVVSRAGVGKASAAFAVLAGVALLAPVAGWKVVGQEIKSGDGIRGVVTDASGARVPNARVTLIFPAPAGPMAGMRIARREITRSDAAGEFRLPSIPTDNYTMQVEQAGFARLEQAGIAVEEGKPSELRLVLNVGGLTETVQMNGEAQTGAAAGTPPLPPPPPPPPPPPGVREALLHGTALAVGQSAGGPIKVRVGGNVMASKLEVKVTPLYPRECKAERIQGTVLLRAVISKAGIVLDLQPVNEFVDARLREAAIAAVRQWRYRPTLLNGEPVEVVTEIEVNFTLRA